ncbi:MAG TPA: transcription antitermination protein NusB [Bacteroidia bacterium]|nr:transcription antitermination protein NusB [Bacteroidia bacterium]
MLNRRYLRIKVLQTLYSFFQGEEKNMPAKERELVASIEKIYDLYIYILLLLIEIRRQADRTLEERKKKHIPTAADINPNRKYIENKALLLIENSAVLAAEKKSRTMGLTSEEDDLVKKLYQLVTASPEYAAYMNDEEQTFEKDRKYIASVYKKLLSDNELLKHHLFEKNIHWASDYMLANICVVKTIESITEEGGLALMPLYKADDDMDFMLELFRKTILSDTENMELIGKKIANWEPERIASMDMLLMKMAITEVMNFPAIPVKVSLNEYIEISKLYSSPKSNTFINGILDAIVKELRSKKQFVKVGRGLIE